MPLTTDPIVVLFTSRVAAPAAKTNLSDVMPSRPEAVNVKVMSPMIPVRDNVVNVARPVASVTAVLPDSTTSVRPETAVMVIPAVAIEAAL